MPRSTLIFHAVYIYIYIRNATAWHIWICLFVLPLSSYAHCPFINSIQYIYINNMKVRICIKYTYIYTLDLLHRYPNNNNNDKKHVTARSMRIRVYAMEYKAVSMINTKWYSTSLWNLSPNAHTKTNCVPTISDRMNKAYSIHITDVLVGWWLPAQFLIHSITYSIMHIAQSDMHICTDARRERERESENIFIIIMTIMAIYAYSNACVCVKLTDGHRDLGSINSTAPTLWYITHKQTISAQYARIMCKDRFSFMQTFKRNWVRKVHLMLFSTHVWPYDRSIRFHATHS